MSKLERVRKQVKCVKSFKKRVCFKNRMNGLENCLKRIGYSVLAIDKNCKTHLCKVFNNLCKVCATAALN